MKRYPLAGSWVMPLLLPMAAEACAVCWAQDAPFSRGFQGTLFFLMVMPLALFGSIAGWLFWAHRRASGRRQAKVPGRRLTHREGQD